MDGKGTEKGDGWMMGAGRGENVAGGGPEE